MVKIKFTPFVLFLILLVVLVISVLFGYKNKIFEGAKTKSSFKEIATVGEKTISVDESSGNFKIDNGTGSPITILSSGSDTAGVTTVMSDTAPEDTHAFVCDDDGLIITYINHDDDIYMLVIDLEHDELVASYTYAKGKGVVRDEPIKMIFKDIESSRSSKPSGNTVHMSRDIIVDIEKDTFKINGKSVPVRSKKLEPGPIIHEDDGSFVICMAATSSASNYVVFSLYAEDDVIKMNPVVLKYDKTYSKDDESDGYSKDMSKYVPKTWLNPTGCPKCPQSGDCSQCGTPGSNTTSAPTATSGSGSGSSAPGSKPGFGNNLVDKTAGIANNAIGGATALGLGAALGATVLGASAVGGATSVGNNAIGGAAGLGNNAIGGATKLGQGVTNAAGQAVGTTGNVLNNTVGTAGGVVNNAVNKLTGLAGGLGTGAKDLLQSGNRTNLQQGQQGQQGQQVQSQYTQYGQLVLGQPPGQQYAGYQFPFPATTCGMPIVSPVVQTGSDFLPSSSKSVIGTGGNYTG